MGRKPVPQPLPLEGSMRPDDPRLGETVPKTAPPDTTSPRSPRSPFRFGQKKADSAAESQVLQVTEVLQQPIQQNSLDDAHHPPLTSPTHQSQRRDQSPAQNQQRGRRHHRQDESKASKSGFFHFGKSSKSTDRLNTYPTTERGEIMSRDSDHPSLSKQSTKHSDSSYNDQTNPKTATILPSKSEVSLASSTEYDNSGTLKKGKPKPFTLLGRTRSIKDNKDSPSPKEAYPAPVRIVEPERAYAPGPLRTAPLQAHDRSFRDMMSSAVRNHSAERSQVRDVSGSSRRDVDNVSNRYQPSSYKENSGSTFLSGLKNSKAAGILSKGFFGGGGRSESATHREPVVDDEHYVLKVINLPLVEQTRKTRISKRLEDSRDKTEFWMPAFPWRAIDYLNYKGSDVEGLYRVPGSGPQIKKWQRRFDEELDVDLFEQPDLYDINIIGSMLKAWLRELPDELFPKAAQDRIARECAGSETVPQLLIDELSNLSPFNYYLLFAITCHLSLLLAHSDKNKMDFRNLCICFQPCMKIDAFCFKFLVCDWRDCWKGCKNEALFIEEEYALFDSPPPRTLPAPESSGETRKNGNTKETVKSEPAEERNVSSSDSSKNSNRSASGGDQKTRLKKKAVPEAESTETSSTISTTLTISSERENQPRGSGDLRPLSPIKPLSPLGF
ncbi:putative Rho-type GTPase-activating protein 2 [Podospora aff. communis PSN243]|uniref:Rho-type GTPase-activating protein 2 n=1 Tax=Podospora aff. communis PSN243 TaxID=3040156 RepID=A0AAV9GJP5_9PEZI|nr:putative Rho-type GTPase-activating protein 2 [Podospora aff. communis PSN243]